MKGYARFPTPNKMFDPVKGHSLYREFLDELEYADELGFDVAALPEQHSKQDNLDPAPNILASFLIARTRRIKILPYGTILPLHNPIRIAEEYAMMDVISNGRLLAGFVRGGPTNYLAYGADYSDGKTKFEEAWELIVKAWTSDEPFQWNGKHYHFDTVSIWPRPYQKPHPPIHTAGGGSIEIASKMGAAVGLGFTSTTDEVKEFVATFQQRWKGYHGKQPTRDRVAVARSIYVADTDEQAKEECEKHLLHQYRVLYPPSILANEKLEKSLNVHLYWASRLFLTKENYDGIVKRGNHIAGSPETVADAINELQSEVEFGTFLGLFRYGDMPHERAKRSMQLFSEKVVPRLKMES
jgi:alkanesulfonate monooxygenase SsuD/methylene tetrahydromethanopterin reductase-like flavin-dependent oxidoreductase (luciferase family)